MATMDAKAGPGSEASRGAAALFSHGTPIRVTQAGVEPQPGKIVIELRSVGNAPIDTHPFDLPGPAGTADAFFAAVSPPPPAEPSEPMLVPDPIPPAPKR